MKLENKVALVTGQLRVERQPLKHSVLQELRWFSQDDANQKVKLSSAGGLTVYLCNRMSRTKRD